MCKPPKPSDRTVKDQPPVEAPRIELGVDNPAATVRSKKRRGRNQLRTDLQQPRTSAGLSVPLP